MCLRALHACSVHGAPSHTRVFTALVFAILGQSFPWKNRSLHIFFFFLAVLSCPEVCVCQGGGGEREGGSWGGLLPDKTVLVLVVGRSYSTGWKLSPFFSRLSWAALPSWTVAPCSHDCPQSLRALPTCNVYKGSSSRS